MTALEGHAVELLATRDLDLEAGGKRVDHGNADAVQTAGGFVDLRVKLAAGMQRAHDDFERGFFRKFGMRVNRDPAPVVGDGQKSVRGQLDLDEAGVAGQRLVHRVVDDFRKQVMQRLFIGAADIHARPPSYRFQAFEDLNIAGGIAGFPTGTA